MSLFFVLKMPMTIVKKSYESVWREAEFVLSVGA